MVLFIVKFPTGTVVSFYTGDRVSFNAKKSPFDSTKTFVNKVAEYICGSINHKELFQKGLNAEILEPGKQWKTGKIRCRLVFDFIPDQLENNRITGVGLCFKVACRCFVQ